MIGLMLVASGAWVISQFNQRPPRITYVGIDPYTHSAVQVRYGDETTPKTFLPFPAGTELTAAVLVDVDGQGLQVVVVGSDSPLDEAGNVLIAFERSRAELWRRPLHSKLQWPDCGPAPEWWLVRHMISGDLDGVLGEELVVVAHDPQEYATRISLVDPTSGEVRHTFWHFGHIWGIRLLAGYFKDGRPALLAWGLNNKLDGFDDELRAGEQQFAHWDKVPVVMILDPLNMDGLSPPRTAPSRELNLPPARPIAYAVLDLASRRTEPYIRDGQAPRKEPRPTNLAADHVATIQDVDNALHCNDEATAPWLRLVIQSGDDNSIKFPNPIVDRNLELCDLTPITVSGDTIGITRDYWFQYWGRYWRVIVKNGEYVGE